MSVIDKGVGTLQKINDIGNSVSELVSTHKQRVIKQVFNIVLLVIILVVFGCFDWVHLSFHFEYLADINYWADVGMKVIADICSYNIGINVVIDDVINRNEPLKRAKTLYEKLNGNKQQDFELFITRVYNPSQKKTMYINKVNRQIYLLNRFSKKSDHILYSSELPEKQELKKTNRYCIKRTQLEYLKSDDYINKNLESLKVNYREVDAAVFELEINGSQKFEQGKVTGSIGKGRATASLSMALGVTLIGMFIRSFSVDPNKQEFIDGSVAAINTVIRMLEDIGIVVWQFFRGVLSATGIVSKQLTLPYTVRIEILKQYYKWRQDNGEWIPKCYTDIFSEKNYVETKEEYEEVEMTPEEYEEYKKKQQAEKENTRG